jgi:phenylacetate-CoA ligase
VRGVNVYPTAIEAVVRTLPEVVEFRATVSRAGAMRTLSVEIEPSPDAVNQADTAAALARELREALGLNVVVQVVEPGSLPRFEMKARRFIVEQ